MREKLVWSTSNFNEAAITRTGATTFNNFFVPVNIYDVVDNLEGPSDKFSVRRVLVNGGIAVTAESTTFAQDICCMFAALMVLDNNDSSSSLVLTNRGELLEGGAERVLWTGCYTWNNIEIPAATLGGPRVEPAPVVFNIDWKGRCNMRLDETMTLAVAFGSDVTSTITGAAFSAITRTLFTHFG